MSTSFDFPSKDFIPVLTADGSPTLRGREGEHMHSLEGALAETVYIYGSVTQTVLEENWPLRFVSVGLGLAYVELVVIAQAISRKAPWAEFYLHSFESDDFLRETLMRFL